MSLRAGDAPWGCRDCGWQGPKSATLTAPNPWDAEAPPLRGCPSCRDVGDFYLVCDEEGCREPWECGTPTPEGYRSTCSKHAPRAK